MSILLLEDDPLVADVLSEALNDEGWVVRVAADLETGRHFFVEPGLRVLVTDRHLANGEDAYEFAMAAYDVKPDLSVIYMTGGTNDFPGHDLREREQAIRKPFPLATLTQAVHQALGTQHHGLGRRDTPNRSRRTVVWT